MFSFWRQTKEAEDDDDDSQAEVVHGITTVIPAPNVEDDGAKDGTENNPPSVTTQSSTFTATQSVLPLTEKIPSEAIRPHTMKYEDALYQTCLRLTTLRSTPLQVSLHYPDLRVPLRQQLLVWPSASTSSGPFSDASTTDFLTKYAAQFGWDRPQPKRSRTSMGTYLASLVVRPASKDHQDDEEDETSQELPVEATDVILCEPLVLECLRYLLRLIHTAPTTPTNPSRAWWVQAGQSDIEAFSFRRWVSPNAAPSHPLQSPTTPIHPVGAVLACLSVADTLWLCQLLEHAGLAKIVSRPDRSKVLILAHDTDAAAGGVATAVDPKMEEYQLAWLDLLQTRHRLERQIHESQEQVSALQNQALRHKRANQLSSAKAVLQRSKVHQQRVDRSHQALLTVEQSLGLLQNSVNNQQVLQVIQQANQVLQSRRIDLDGVDDVLEDLSEHVEEANQINDTLASFVNATDVGATDDDELLQELNLLTLHDRGDQSLEERPIEEPRMPTLPEFPVLPMASPPNDAPVHITSNEPAEPTPSRVAA